MEQGFNENQNNEIVKKNGHVLEEIPKSNVKVDGTNVLNAARHFEKNMYKSEHNLGEYNKPGIPSERKRRR